MAEQLTRWLVAALVGLLVAACSASPSGVPTDRPAVSVVATTTVFADLVAQVGGARVAVSSLVPMGGEVHTFDPTPATATRVAQADLLVMNGLGLDDWLRQLVADSGSQARVIGLGEDLPGAVYLDSGGAPNPHLWLDVTYAQGYVTRIADALRIVDPAGADTYDANAADLDGTLSELDAWAKATLAAIPEERRRIVAFHDALPYFARAYGITIVGIVLPSPGQDPSAGYIAALVDEIRRTGARAIVSEVQFSPAMAETLSRETGVTVVSDFYVDTLGDPPADSYAGIIRWDVERLAEALR